MKKILALIAIVVIFMVGFFIWWINGNSPVSKSDSSSVVFVIPKGAAIRTIGNDLKSKGLVRDPVVFFLYIKKNNLDKKIQAGSYKVSPSMSLSEVVDTLLTGSIDIWITVPEGYRAEQIAEVLSESVETYDESWVNLLKQEEGYLFPDTYLVPKDAEIQTVINIMKNTFNAKIAEAGITAEGATLDEIVTIASLIEREAITDDEKPLISSVISNRLNDGMSLDIDATLQYVKGKTDGKWWSVPMGADRQLNSAYNTYRNPGVPPTPIANPGIEAIKAAVNPASSDYYYYIHDTTGQIHFAKTLEEHNANVAKYL